MIKTIIHLKSFSVQIINAHAKTLKKILHSLENYLIYYHFYPFPTPQSKTLMKYLDNFRFLLLGALFSLMIPFLHAQVYTVSGTAYLDYANDGNLDAKDLRHPALTVQVYSDANGNGLIDAGEPMIGSAVSGLNGTFSISIDHSGGLPLDDYLIKIDDNDLAPGSTNSVIQVPAGNASVDVPYLGQPVICYSVADAAFDQLMYMNRISGTNSAAGSPLGVTEVETAAFEPGGKRFFAINANELGTINLVTGAFVPKNSKLGIVNGAGGAVTITDADGLSFDPFTGKAFAAVRISGGPDLLIQVDTSTGEAVNDAFGTGIDYIEIHGTGLKDDIDDIAINPTNGKLYGVNNARESGDNTEEFLVEIDKKTGAATILGQLTYTGPNTGLNVKDVEGFGFTNFGLLVATTGNEGPWDTRERMYAVDLSTGNMSLINGFDSGTDFESCDCLIGAINVLSGTVFEDIDRDGVNNGEPPLQGVKVRMYIDQNGDGMVDAGDIAVDSVLTKADGTFSWSTASNVKIVMNIDGGTLPPGYTSTDDGIEDSDLSCCFGGVTDTGNDFGAFTPVFPVEWISFTATYEGRHARVSWATASELNSDYFQLERSLNGYNFYPVGRIQAQGTTSAPTAYEYLDREAHRLGSKLLYYRLKQVDLDGSSVYSPQVELQLPLQAFRVEVFPNPAQQGLWLRFNHPDPQSVAVQLLDLRGRLLRRDVLQSPGELQWDVSSLPSGIYYLRFTLQGRVSYEKLVIE